MYFSFSPFIGLVMTPVRDIADIMLHAYLGGLEEQISVSRSDPECVAIRDAIGTDLTNRQRLQRFSLTLTIQRHTGSRHAQPQLLREASCRAL